MEDNDKKIHIDVGGRANIFGQEIDLGGGGLDGIKKVLSGMGLNVEESSHGPRPIVKRSGRQTTERQASEPMVDKSAIEDVLEFAQRLEGLCEDWLKALPHDMPEYDSVMEKHGQIQELVQELKKRLLR